eukprot:gene6868-7642_t
MTNYSLVSTTTIGATAIITNITSSVDEHEYNWTTYFANNIITYAYDIRHNVVAMVVSFIIAVLNAIEIGLISRKWKTVTQFEIILLNLAFADILVGITYFILACLEIHEYRNKSINYKLYKFIFDFGIFSVTTSSLFVIFIGLQRLEAVRQPLKSHMRDKTKFALLKYIIVVWVASIATTLAASLSDHFVNPKVLVASKNLALALGISLCTFIFIILVIYSLIGYSILRRHSAFYTHGKQDSVHSHSGTTGTVPKKDRATILACSLVMVIYLVCNLPFAVRLLQFEIKRVETALMTCNSLFNPLIYFFKSYLERRFNRTRSTIARGITFKNTTMESNDENKSNNKTATVVANLNVKDNSI